MAKIIPYSRRQEIGESTIIVFDHIPKCAGTSFEAWLTSACGGRRIFAHCHADYMELKRRREHDFKVIADHYTWGAHFFLPEELSVAYVTMIRDPLRVALSWYNYARNQLFGEYGLDINSYLLDYSPNMFTNHLGQGDLCAAKERLFETYCAFGMVERYQQSLDLVADTFGFETVPQTMGKRNVSQGVRHEISAAVLEIFMAANSDDYALYAAAEREFGRRAAGIDRAPERVEECSGAGDVVFTDTLPDVRALLDRQEYAQALALLCGEHLDNLQRHMLLFAAQLAQKIGDVDMARMLFAKLRDRFANTYADHIAEFLMSQDEYAQALALVEGELVLLEGAGDMPVDSSFFNTRVRYLCLALKASWHVAPDRVDQFVDRLAVWCGMSEGAFLSLVHTLSDVGACARAVEVYRCFEHVAWKHPGRVYSAMISACYNGGQYEEARAFCCKVLALSPHDAAAIRFLVVMDRRTGRFELDMEPWAALARRLSGTRQSSAILREIAMHHYDSGNPEKAFEVVASLPALPEDSMLAVACRTHKVVDFQTLALEDLLVIRSGPNLVFDHVYGQVLKPRGLRFDAIGVGQEAAAGKYTLIDRCCAFPGPRYLHSADFEAISRQLGGKVYADCLIVMSDFDYLSYREIFKLASALAVHRISLYSLSHLLSGEHARTMLELQSAALREAG